jgi:hypothetical protein
MIPFDMLPVLDEFIRRITAYDEVTGIIDYKMRNKTTGADYTFAGVLIPPSDEDLQLLDEGDIKAGSIVVYTRGKELFFTDVQNKSANQRQTFIKHDSKIYRIKSGSNRTEDGLYRKYMAVRQVVR